MTKGNDLQAKLARSLDKANKKTTKPKPAKLKPPAAGKCSKLSVSLFQTDLERLKAIRVYMAGKGEMISTSQAVKLALRAAPISDSLLSTLEQIRNEDGR